MYLRNCFAMCGLILKSYTFLLIRRVGDALFVEIPKGRVGALEAYGDKLNIPRQRPERIFHWICFVMSGFICQRRTYSLFVCVCVWVSRLEMLFLLSVWEDISKPINSGCPNQIVPPRKAMKKRNDLWNCFAWLDASHRVKPFFWFTCWKHAFSRICQGIFGSPWRPMLKNQISPEKQ